MFIDKMKKRPLNINNDTEFVVQTTLAEGMTIKDGNLYGSSSITISGVFFGDVDIEGALVVTESGNLKGEVRACEAHIHGIVEGSITAKGKVHIYADSSVTGDIFSSSLIIEDGAVYRGACSTGALQTSNLLNIAGTILNQQGAGTIADELSVSQSNTKGLW